MVELQVKGQTYRLDNFISVTQEFLDWANVQLGHPLANIKDHVRDFPPELQKQILATAMEQASKPRTIESPDVQSLLATPKGSFKIMHLILKRNHPEVTEREAEQVWLDALEEHGGQYLADKLAAVKK